MASMAASASDEAIASTMQNVVSGERIDAPGSNLGAGDDDESTRVWRSIDSENGDKPRRIADNRRRQVQRSLDSLEAGPADEHPSLDPDFIKYTDEMLREGHLNYLALTGEMARTTLWREDGVVHCPGTTQARSQLEAAGGACSMVEIDVNGEVRITSVDTSCVDWKTIEVNVRPHTTLSAMLQQMKTCLMELKPSSADRIWSVSWVLRGVLPALQELTRSDLDVAAAVELDELRHAGRTIRLLHDIRTLPNGWPYGDPPTSLADQFQAFVTRSKQLSDETLQAMIDGNEDLTAGWKQRLTSLLPSVDPEQILAKMRTDGAKWFDPDYALGEILSERDPDEEYEEQLLDDSSVTVDAESDDEVLDVDDESIDEEND